MPQIDRSKSNLQNYEIYAHLPEQSLAALTDEEFAILQKKLPPNTIQGGTLEYEKFTGNNINSEELSADKQLPLIYKRAVAAKFCYFDCFYRYTGVFKLCRALGVKNIYDIGCGSGLQAFLLIGYPDVTYTGFDPYMFQSPIDGFKSNAAQINGLFYEFTGSDRIYYIDKAYPCGVTPDPNNIAILLYTMMNRDVSQLAAQLSQDFERIIVTLPNREFAWKGKNVKEIVYRDVELWTDPFDKLLTQWKKSMPNYRFYQIREQNTILATKIPTDDTKIKQKYTVSNDNILAGAIDLSSNLDY